MLQDASTIRQLQASVGVAFTGEFQSPRFDGLRVTPEGRVTIAFAREVEKLAQELGDLIGQEGVHPIIVLLPPGATTEEWQQTRLLPLVQLCVIPRALTRVEETFLVKYSARGKIFQLQDILSAKAQSTRGTMQQLWQRETADWRKEVEQRGYLVRPLWYAKAIGEADFARGYRAMLANDWNIDRLAPDVYSEFDAAVYDQVRKACQYNADPGPNQEPLLEIVTRDEPYAPVIPPLFGTLLRTLKSQTAIDTLKRPLFCCAGQENQDHQTAGANSGAATHTGPGNTGGQFNLSRCRCPSTEELPGSHFGLAHSRMPVNVRRNQRHIYRRDSKQTAEAKWKCRRKHVGGR